MKSLSPGFLRLKELRSLIKTFEQLHLQSVREATSSLASEFSSEFVQTSLRLGRHVDGIVDSYFGPSELKDAITKEPMKPLEDILLDLHGLEKRVTSCSSEKLRITFIQKQIGALRTIAEQKMGKDIPYLEFVAKTLDVKAHQVKEKEISKVRNELQELLKRNGYEGSLTEMISSFRKRNPLSGQVLADEFHRVANEARSKTKALIALPPVELAELNVVSDKPWGAYNWYLGNYRSRIDLNTDIPVPLTRLPTLVFHEVYPGHHTEHASKELELYSRRKQLESSILLINTPDCAMSEGLADAASEFVIGKPGSAADRIEKLAQSQGLMANVNTALLVHDRHVSLEEAKNYFMEQGAIPKEEVDKRIRFILDPLWRGYIFAYYEGEKLIEQAWKRAKEAQKEPELIQILYREENCPTTFMEKTRKIS
jgi:hypothetical protein